ncbi:MAG: hypothetical protein A3E01_15270 [Gammaproteobacteria bacterium RIFCSPHIGHO2_12_FULL_63_22]|nr:MAG: hypothetical protein A3E01_15270 [Gammaproteobacteria bacterium RIFCSPHIGHO2_12_FULL_63_22]
MICQTCGNPHEGRGSRCQPCLLHPPPEQARQRSTPTKGKGQQRSGSAPYQPQSATSRAGAIAALPHIETQTERCVRVLQEYGPATRNELALRSNIVLSAVCARVNPLLADQRDADGRLIARQELRVAGQRSCRVSGHTAEVLEYLSYETWRERML